MAAIKICHETYNKSGVMINKYKFIVFLFENLINNS